MGAGEEVADSTDRLARICSTLRLSRLEQGALGRFDEALQERAQERGAVTRWAKLLACAAVLLLNLLMVYWVLLFALSAGREDTEAFVVGIHICLAYSVLVFDPFKVTWAGWALGRPGTRGWLHGGQTA